MGQRVTMRCRRKRGWGAFGLVRRGERMQTASKSGFGCQGQRQGLSKSAGTVLEGGQDMDELLARGAMALLALVRATRLLKRAQANPDYVGVVRVARVLRRAAELLHDSADTLEMWGEWAKLREERSGAGGLGSVPHGGYGTAGASVRSACVACSPEDLFSERERSSAAMRHVERVPVGRQQGKLRGLNQEEYSPIPARHGGSLTGEGGTMKPLHVVLFRGGRGEGAAAWTWAMQRMRGMRG